MWENSRAVHRSNVFRRFPVARTVVDSKGSEREETSNLIPSIPTENNLILFDRGYPSYELIHELKGRSGNNFIFRCPATSTFKTVKEFVSSKKQEDYIWIKPTGRYLSKKSSNANVKHQSVKLRVIRLESPSDGTVSVILTDLYNLKKYSAQEITNLYFKRWEVEVYYRDEKTVLDIETFHSRTVNGILQELYAVAIMRVIARMMIVISSEHYISGDHPPQIKNTIIAISSDLGCFASDDPEKAISIFKEALKEIARVKYYKTPKKRPSCPRVNKGPNNRWKDNKRKKSMILQKE